MEKKYSHIVNKFIHWGETCDTLQAALIIGSQARKEHEADDCSDLDLVMIVDSHEPFITSKQWLENFGTLHISHFVNINTGGWNNWAWRTVFNDILDIDFAIVPKKEINTYINPWVLRRGYTILIDKIDLINTITQMEMPKISPALPDEESFINLANELWYLSVWTAKKIKRGELWTAKVCLDSTMKQKLLTLIEWHTYAIQGLDCNTWYDGRFIEEWAQKWIIKKLANCFSHYSKSDMKKALLSTMELINLIAIEFSQKSNFTYSQSEFNYAINTIQKISRDS
jgi:aminoglycoside 6-adenylyltransferase